MKRILLLAALTLSASVSAQTVDCHGSIGSDPIDPKLCVHTVPEPSPLLLLAPAALMLVVVGRRKRRA